MGIKNPQLLEVKGSGRKLIEYEKNTISLLFSFLPYFFANSKIAPSLSG
jgi:hypothetical protein